MTATSVDVIAHLDFEPTLPCECRDCSLHPDTARPAIQLIITTMPCCTRRTPICEPCSAWFRRAVNLHGSMTCTTHHITQCAHLTITFEPLP